MPSRPPTRAGRVSDDQVAAMALANGLSLSTVNIDGSGRQACLDVRSVASVT